MPRSHKALVVRKSVLFFTCLILGLLVRAAKADAISNFNYSVYSVTGTFADGTTLSGGFTLQFDDPSLPAVLQGGSGNAPYQLFLSNSTIPFRVGGDSGSPPDLSTIEVTGIQDGVFEGPSSLSPLLEVFLQDNSYGLSENHLSGTIPLCSSPSSSIPCFSVILYTPNNVPYSYDQMPLVSGELTFKTAFITPEPPSKQLVFIGLVFVFAFELIRRRLGQSRSHSGPSAPLPTRC